jgi:predicted nucleotidyltransferase
MTERDRILQALTDRQELLQALGVRRIGLFGSQARGDATEASDLDVLVEFKPGAKTFDHYMDLKELLEGLFGTKVDLVIAEAIKARLRERILGETVYAPGF